MIIERKAGGGRGGGNSIPESHFPYGSIPLVFPASSCRHAWSMDNRAETDAIMGRLTVSAV